MPGVQFFIKNIWNNNWKNHLSKENPKYTMVPPPTPHPPPKKYVDSKASSSTFTILPVQNGKLGISYSSAG